MLSPTAPTPPTEGSALSPSSPSTRRRGLSYLRSLSSHGNSSDQGRNSPRSFFQRSSSYNNENKRPGPNRRRSASKPDEPTNVQRETIARGNSADDLPATNESEEQREDTSDDMRAQSSPRASGTELASAVTRTTSHDPEPKGQLPTLRFFPHHDVRNGRQSLNFSPISRTLPADKTIIRVGRYSEREGLPISNPMTPTDAPVGFKSKVVSRRHCEFSFADGQWYIKDVASSSGTFLNHIRLSQPNNESRLFPVKDGDIVQLGIDFRGGEEMIFRCVKIRIECNRSWQKKPNKFNKTRRAQLLSLTKDQPATNSGECSICLEAVLPCQSLFVAPCAHVWHYKCIRPMLEGRQSQYPQFQCPNCRAWTDLEADVDINEDEMDEWMETRDTDEHLDIDQADRPQTAAEAETVEPMTNGTAPTINTPTGLLARRQATNPGSPEISAVNNISMPARLDEDDANNALELQRTNIETPNSDQIIAGEGPLTPRNNAGPFVFDGSGSRRLMVPGLDEVTEER